MMVHVPLRTCVGCRAQDEQSQLIRVALQVRDGVPHAVLDASRSLPGRGAWLHVEQKCLAAALKKGAFNRAFRTKVSTAELVIEA